MEMLIDEAQTGYKANQNLVILVVIHIVAMSKVACMSNDKHK